jgi:formylglycine-generating enzyme required for sulfatase activity
MSSSKFFAAASTGLCLAFSANLAAGAPVDFTKDVKPILEQNCVACHDEKKGKENGHYRLDVKDEAIKPHRGHNTINPGHPEDSLFCSNLTLPMDEDRHMPPKQRDQLSKEQIDILNHWVAEGANWPDGVKLKAVQRVNFVRDIEPIMEDGGPLSDAGKATFNLWLDQGAVWPASFKVTDSGGSTTSATPTGGAKLDFAADIKPIFLAGGPLSAASIQTLRTWLDQGAPWPEGMSLGGGKTFAHFEDVHKFIQENSPALAEAQMAPYTNTIPGTKVSYSMVPIRGGEFMMGSPDSEPSHNADEGPQHKVKIEPFWMEKCEVTWNEYELFMYPDELKQGSPTTGTSNYTSELVDAVARPSKPYVEMSFGMGKDGYPAISMTQHAANIYCEWLSAKTGHFYRLPTEAEYEYACRAGTTTAYFFGDDPKNLGQYAWFADNSDSKYQKVGTKKPNPWGLYDIIGNVVEWTLDQYDPNYYQKFKGIEVTEPWNKSTKPYPQVVRGGSWQDDPDKLRSACRRGSSPDWKMQDPQLPKSIWYHTDAQFLGFRIVRPLKVPSPAEMKKYWHSGVQGEN